MHFFKHVIFFNEIKTPDEGAPIIHAGVIGIRIILHELFFKHVIFETSDEVH